MGVVLDGTEDILDSAQNALWHWDDVVEGLNQNGIDLLQNTSDETTYILDLGSGAGILARELNKEKGLRCVSLDMQKKDKNEGALQVQSEASHLPFPSDTFDVVHANAFFDPEKYNNNRLEIFAEIRRVLKPPSGVLVIAGANIDMLDDRIVTPYFEHIGGIDTIISLWKVKILDS